MFLFQYLHYFWALDWIDPAVVSPGPESCPMLPAGLLQPSGHAARHFVPAALNY